MPTTRIGISGWTYPSWRSRFYPKHLPHRNELAYASRQYRSIEINGSFYSLQSPDGYRHWYEATPRGFAFAIKAPRFITHVRRLKDSATPLANFFASGVLALREKLGPLLWQLPATMRYDEKRMETFLSLLPHDSEQMARMARKHDNHLSRTQLSIDRKRRIRHAIEVRNESFANETFIAQLRRHRVALVVSDAAEWPRMEDITAGFMYLRLHGNKQLYSSGYTGKAIHAWATRIRAWQAGRQPRGAHRTSKQPPPKRTGRDIYCYFDNDAKVKAPFDALSLIDELHARKR